MGAAYLRQVIANPRRIVTIALSAGLGLAAAWVALWQSGSFMVRSDDGLNIGGFGEWSANLLTFIMPTEPLTLLAPGPIPYARATQYEGYAYLGGGMVLLHDIRPTTVRVLGRLLEWLSAHRWREDRPDTKGYAIVDLVTYMKETARAPQPFADRAELEISRARAWKKHRPKHKTPPAPAHHDDPELAL